MPPRRATFGVSKRLTHAREFQAVYAARCCKALGPLALHGNPNGRPNCRFGLSVGRRVGCAVKRNRVKRLLREAFRLMQADWVDGPRGGYDLVVVVRPHDEDLTLAECQRLLFGLMRRVDDEWCKRRRKDGSPA